MILSKRGLLLIDGILLLFLLLLPLAARWLLMLPSDCYFQRFGLLCPACGGTRCVLSLLKGQFVEAFQMNPYFVITGFFLLLSIFLLHMAVFSKCVLAHKLCAIVFHPRTVILWAVGFAVFGILRNV